jgi:CRP-like cAMP-binding protein
MALETNAELLGRVPIFQGLQPEQLTAIAGCGREVHFEQGSAVLSAGEHGHAAFLILSGSVAPEPFEDTQNPPEFLGYGTFLGELAMLVETTFSINVLARWQVRAMALDRSAMQTVMEADPAIAFHFSNKLIERLRLLAGDLRRMEGRFANLELSVDQVISRAQQIP